LAHTQGKKHQANLARRAAKEAKDAPQQVSVFLHPYSTWCAFLTHGSATVCDELLVYTHKDSILISTLDWGPVRT
jgi:Splicing factor 3a, subunit 2